MPVIWALLDTSLCSRLPCHHLVSASLPLLPHLNPLALASTLPPHLHISLLSPHPLGYLVGTSWLLRVMVIAVVATVVVAAVVTRGPLHGGVALGIMVVVAWPSFLSSCGPSPHHRVALLFVVSLPSSARRFPLLCTSSVPASSSFHCSSSSSFPPSSSSSFPPLPPHRFPPTHFAFLFPVFPLFHHIVSLLVVLPLIVGVWGCSFHSDGNVSSRMRGWDDKNEPRHLSWFVFRNLPLGHPLNGFPLIILPPQFLH